VFEPSATPSTTNRGSACRTARDPDHPPAAQRRTGGPDRAVRGGPRRP
jgi:hypothetical protein